MYISYFDESGDDGYPKYSSELFVLVGIYMHHTMWKSNYEKLHHIRKELKTEFGLPVKQEFHTKEFITNKLPYHSKYDEGIRRSLLFAFCEKVTRLDFKTIIVVIDKKRIPDGKNYDVTKNALTYNIQRIEMTLGKMIIGL